MLLALLSTLGAGLAAMLLTTERLTLLSTFGAVLTAMLLTFGAVLTAAVLATMGVFALSATLGPVLATVVVLTLMRTFSAVLTAGVFTLLPTLGALLTAGVLTGMTSLAGALTFTVLAAVVVRTLVATLGTVFALGAVLTGRSSALAALGWLGRRRATLRPGPRRPFLSVNPVLGVHGGTPGLPTPAPPTPVARAMRSSGPSSSPRPSS